MDPLSQQVFNRTQTPPILPPGLLRPVSSATTTNPDDKRSEERRESTGASKSSPLRTDSGLTLHGSKKKGVSFISRFIPGKKKDASEFGSDDESQHSEVRPEGMEAQVFSQPIDNIEYNPSHPQPPAYIKVRARHKKVKDFDRLFLAQELLAKPEQQDPPRSGSMHSSRKRSHAEERGTIWAMEFSRDGRYLAVAGHDKVVRVWAVICSTEDRKTSEGAESKNTERPRMRLSAPVFQSRPIREYEGHTSTVLDLSWSKNNFLLSSSMDKTVRLWHVTRAECLCTFKHNDFVPSIAFHPRDDRFFLAGSLDAKLRLWSIPDKTVAYSTQLPDMITAVAFTPDGKFVMAGCSNGLCMFYETENLKYHTQIVVRSSHGKNAKGSKITGIQAVSWPVGSVNGDIKLLISSNDSRVRMYNFRDKSMDMKFKGNENNCSQIRASFSDDGRYVICGSEDQKAYIWSLGPSEGDKRDKRPMEVFDANNTITTCVAFAPTKTRHLLARSEDPIYDLCNPPPVMLMSRAERGTSQSSSKAPTDSGMDSAQTTPAEADGRFKRPEESPAYTARLTHNGGNIIVTADFTGRIKVFRQDCAWSKRKPDTDTVSVFSKRKLGRTASVNTKASNRSLRSERSHLGPSERILSWRAGIASNPSIANGSIRSGRSNGNRSVSPRKSVGALSARSSQTRTETNLRSAATTTESLPSTTTTNTPSMTRNSSANDKSLQHQGQNPKSQSTPEVAQDPLMLQAGTGQSNLFWNRDIYAEQARGQRPPAEHHSNLEVPGSDRLDRVGSVVSQLTIERSSGDESDSRSRSHSDAGSHLDKR